MNQEDGTDLKSKLDVLGYAASEASEAVKTQGRKRVNQKKVRQETRSALN